MRDHYDPDPTPDCRGTEAYRPKSFEAQVCGYISYFNRLYGYRQRHRQHPRIRLLLDRLDLGQQRNRERNRYRYDLGYWRQLHYPVS